MLPPISFLDIKEDRSLIMTHKNFVKELMKMTKDSETVMYAYEKSGKFSAIYYYKDDMKQDKENHNLIFEKEPRIDKYLDTVIYTLNKYDFEDIVDFKIKKIQKNYNIIYISFK